MSLMLFWSSSSRFSGFRSRCAILSWCEYSRLEIIYWKILRASSSDSFSRRAIRSNNSPPAAYSSTMKISVCVSINSKSLMVCGLLKRLKIFSSRLTFSNTPNWRIFFLLSILIATLCPVYSWNAILTLPNVPFPRFLENRYCPIRISFIDIFETIACWFAT